MCTSEYTYSPFIIIQSVGEYVAMCIALGDVFGLGLAVAAGGDGEAELARLSGIQARFPPPQRGAAAHHFEAAEGGWLAHHFKDEAGRLTIKTKVIRGTGGRCRFLA